MTSVLMINTVPTERNGITNVIFNLVTAMDKTDLRVDLLTINTPEESYTAAIRSGGGEVYTIHSRLRNPAAYCRELTRLIRRNRYDIVHAHGNSSTLALEMLAAKLAGCPLRLAHSHSTTCKSLMLHRVLKPLFAVCCNGHLACGEAAGKWLYGDQDFTVINNGIDTRKYGFFPEKRADFRQRLGAGEEDILLGHVGLLSELKNQSFLLDILGDLLAEGGRYRLMLIGGGDLRTALEQKAADLGVSSRVSFLGERSDVADWLNAADLIIMPSQREGFPLTLVEEQANGLSCLISDTITKAVNITGNVTFASLQTDAKAWSEIVRRMKLRTDRESSSREAIVQIIAQGYSIESEAEKLKTYYRNQLTGV